MVASQYLRGGIFSKNATYFQSKTIRFHYDQTYVPLCDLYPVGPYIGPLSYEKSHEP